MSVGDILCCITTVLRGFSDIAMPLT